MNLGTRITERHPRVQHAQRGVALVVALLLLLVMTLLAVTGLATATLELTMAANAEYQQRAFAAAEFAIEQAISLEGIGTTYTYALPKTVPVSGSPPGVPGSPSDTYSYRLYFDRTTDPWPATGVETTAGLKAYHFIIEATGRSARGATDTHVQGFYVLGPDPAPAALTPPVCGPGCSDPSAYGPKRTYWLQQNAD